MDERNIASALKKEDIDAYIIYDFRGSNFLGRKILGFETTTTRKFVSILAVNGIFHLVSKMESSNYKALPGKLVTYVNYRDFEESLKHIIKSYKKIALDISDSNSLPITDLAPYGFVELVKKLCPRVKIVSSENLTQALVAAWGKKGYISHKSAVDKLSDIFTRTFGFIAKNVQHKKLTDLDAMNYALNLQKKAGLHSDGENICIIASGEDTKNPHYWPHTESPHRIKPSSPLLIDMWARTEDEGSIYADFTMFAWVGPEKPPSDLVKAWNLWKKARDTGITFISDRVKKGVRGFEADLAIRKIFTDAGYAKYLLHRSGHSLGQKEHGNGANIDDFETHDTRLILPDTGLTIEPGLYMEKYGVRGEIDLYVHEDFRVEVTTPMQEGLIIV